MRNEAEPCALRLGLFYSLLVPKLQLTSPLASSSFLNAVLEYIQAIK
jgi:hypothetical protein